MSDLLPCPFCGSNNLRTGLMYFDDDGEQEGVECIDCDASNRLSNWNDRASQWIAAEGMLPEFGVAVLGYCPIYGRSVRVYTEILDWAGNWDDPLSGHIGGLPPTHWQPLPEPPK